MTLKCWKTFLSLVLGCLLMMGLASVALAEAPAEPTESVEPAFAAEPAPEALPSLDEGEEVPMEEYTITTEPTPGEGPTVVEHHIVLNPPTEAVPTNNTDCACFSCECTHSCEALMGQNVQANQTPFDPTAQPTSNCGCVHSCESMKGLSMNHHHTHHHQGEMKQGQKKTFVFSYRSDAKQQKIEKQQKAEKQSSACPNCPKMSKENHKANRRAEKGMMRGQKNRRGFSFQRGHGPMMGGSSGSMSGGMGSGSMSSGSMSSGVMDGMGGMCGGQNMMPGNSQQVPEQQMQGEPGEQLPSEQLPELPEPPVQPEAPANP